MPLRRLPRPLSVLASALAGAGIVLAVVGCGHITPLGPDPAPVSMPPAGVLNSPIILQVMRSQPPTATGQCPAGSVDLFGLALVPRASVQPVLAGPPAPVGQVNTATPAATPATNPPVSVGVACYVPVGSPVTITYAAVSSVATYPAPASAPNEPATYGFSVAFPIGDVAAVSAVTKQAYDSGDAIGMTVDGKLWQAPQPRRPSEGRGAQIVLLSKSQAVQLHRLLVPSG
jgi:hypothetical protein